MSIKANILLKFHLIGLIFSSAITATQVFADPPPDPWADSAATYASSPSIPVQSMTPSVTRMEKGEQIWKNMRTTPTPMSRIYSHTSQSL